MLTRPQAHDSDEENETDSVTPSVTPSVSLSLSVTRKARPLSPSRLLHLLATHEQAQYRMRSREDLLRDRINALFAQKRRESLHARVLTREDLPEAMKCAIRGDVANLRRELFIGYRERLNERNKTSGRTLLHEAAAGGHFDCVKLLCNEFRRDLQIDKPTLIGGSTALHLAVTHDHRAVAALLLTYGADMNTQDREGCTPLHLVVSLSMTKLLLKTHVDVIIRNTHGRTACEEYIHRTPVEAQIKDIMDILKQREMTRALQVMRIRTEAEEALREKELDRHALVNQNESRASQIGRNNIANLRVLVKSEEEIRRDREKEREKREARARQKHIERENNNINKNINNNNTKSKSEKTLRPLQAKAALLARLTKSSHTHKKTTKSDERTDDDQEGVLSAVSDDYDEDDNHSDDDNNNNNNNEKSLRVVTAKQLKREMLHPPVKHVVINQRFIDGSKKKKADDFYK